MTLTTQKAAELRKPFAPDAVGKLPKPISRDAAKGNCPECHSYHGLPAVHLDYVGHAAVTDRLLAVDPEWSWEPMAVTDLGLPCLDNGGNLWIRLTICGVTRIGVGDGKSAKECIGDAIRNAAMRFGVALDLWGKEELEQVGPGADKLRAALAGGAGSVPADAPAGDRMRGILGQHGILGQQAPVDDALASGGQVAPAEESQEPTPHTAGGITAAQLKKLHTCLGKVGMGGEENRDEALAYYKRVTGREVASSKDLSLTEAGWVIEDLERAERGEQNLLDPATANDPALEAGDRS